MGCGGSRTIGEFQNKYKGDYVKQMELKMAVDELQNFLFGLDKNNIIKEIKDLQYINEKKSPNIGLAQLFIFRLKIGENQIKEKTYKVWHNFTGAIEITEFPKEDL